MTAVKQNNYYTISAIDSEFSKLYHCEVVDVLVKDNNFLIEFGNGKKRPFSLEKVIELTGITETIEDVEVFEEHGNISAILYFYNYDEEELER